MAYLLDTIEAMQRRFLTYSQERKRKEGNAVTIPAAIGLSAGETKRLQRCLVAQKMCQISVYGMASYASKDLLFGTYISFNTVHLVD